MLSFFVVLIVLLLVGVHTAYPSNTDYVRYKYFLNRENRNFLLHYGDNYTLLPLGVHYLIKINNYRANDMYTVQCIEKFTKKIAKKSYWRFYKIMIYKRIHHINIVNMSRKMDIILRYYNIKSVIPVLQICHDLYYFYSNNIFYYLTINNMYIIYKMIGVYQLSRAYLILMI